MVTVGDGVRVTDNGPFNQKRGVVRAVAGNRCRVYLHGGRPAGEWFPLNSLEAFPGCLVPSPYVTSDYHNNAAATALGIGNAFELRDFDTRFDCFVANTVFDYGETWELAPLLIPPAPRFLIPNEAYSWGLTNVGQVGTYAITSGTLPAGISFNTETGVFSGTPTTPGVSTLVVQCTGALGSDSVTVKLQVVAGQYWVNKATGNDSNAGTSSGAAWSTFAKVFSTVAATGNFLIHVADGTYPENNGVVTLLWYA